jgi:hypothetical protein
VDDGADVTIQSLHGQHLSRSKNNHWMNAMPAKKPAQSAQPEQANEPSLAEQIHECRAGLNRLLSAGGDTKLQRQRLNELLVQQAGIDAEQGRQQAVAQAAQQAAEDERAQRIARHAADLQSQRDALLSDLKARFTVRSVVGQRLV